MGRLVSPSFTVFTGAWGEHFQPYIEGWWDAVLAMDPAPSEVVLVYGDPDWLGVSKSVPEGVPFPVVKIPYTGVRTVANLWNAAVDHAKGDWLLPVPIDDRVTPDAMRELAAADAAGAEIIADAVRFKSTGQVWQGIWLPSLMGYSMTVPTFAPFKRSLRDRIPVLFPSIYYSDWGFYMQCVKANAAVFQGSTVRLVYNDELGVGRESEMSDERKAAADAEAREFALSLGIIDVPEGP